MGLGAPLVQDEGVDKGTGIILDCVGAGISCDCVDPVCTISVAGGGGGGCGCTAGAGMVAAGDVFNIVNASGGCLTVNADDIGVTPGCVAAGSAIVAAQAGAFLVDPADCVSPGDSWPRGVGLSGGAACESLDLGTDTAGNYVASVATTPPLAGGAAGSEGAALTISIPQATEAQDGYLAAADYKRLRYVTAKFMGGMRGGL